MQYPLISEYLAAIREAKDNLDTLSHLVPVLDKYGEPYRSSGAFAVVFKMKDEQTGKCYALKCFTEEQEGRAEAYRQIAEELEFVESPYITSVKYLEKEMFVGSNCEDEEFPVLLMDWIEGETMETYIAANYTDTHAMSMLCYRFCKMAAWLRSQSFAHGDIKPDNIMVRPDGTLTLVDYDGMFVPAMKGQKSPTIGTKDFSHPLRTIDDFDETIDDFALASIALSLKAISLDPSLLQTYGASDRLLFSAADYLDLSKSKTFTALQGLLADEEAKTLLSMFLLASAKKNLSMCSFRLFGVQKPKEEEVWSTKVTKEDLENVFERFPRLKERTNQIAGTLSGGEQQMLAMGRALMSRPKLLMLDEPSMGLAPILVEQIFDIIKELHKAGSTILLVEQNAEMALKVANRAYVLESGRITLTGTGAELAASDQIKKAYLGG